MTVVICVQCYSFFFFPFLWPVRRYWFGILFDRWSFGCPTASCSVFLPTNLHGRELNENLSYEVLILLREEVVGSLNDEFFFFRDFWLERGVCMFSRWSRGKILIGLCEKFALRYSMLVAGYKWPAQCRARLSLRWNIMFDVELTMDARTCARFARVFISPCSAAGESITSEHVRNSKSSRINVPRRFEISPRKQ